MSSGRAATRDWSNALRIRARFGTNELDIRINFLLNRRSATIAAVDEMVAFALRFDAKVHVDAVHYSPPNFQEEHERELHFPLQHKPAIDRVIKHLLKLKAAEPDLLIESAPTLDAVGGWAMERQARRIPCDARKLL